MFSGATERDQGHEIHLSGSTQFSERIKICTAQKMKFSLMISLVNEARFVANRGFDHFVEKILNGKVHFLCNVSAATQVEKCRFYRCLQIEQPKLCFHVNIILFPQDFCSVETCIIEAYFGNPVGVYMFKGNNKDTRTMPLAHSHLILVFSALTLSR